MTKIRGEIKYTGRANLPEPSIQKGNDGAVLLKHSGSDSKQKPGQKKPGRIISAGPEGREIEICGCAVHLSSGRGIGR